MLGRSLIVVKIRLSPRTDPCEDRISSWGPSSEPEDVSTLSYPDNARIAENSFSSQIAAASSIRGDSDSVTRQAQVAEGNYRPTL